MFGRGATSDSVPSSNCSSGVSESIQLDLVPMQDIVMLVENVVAPLSSVLARDSSCVCVMLLSRGESRDRK